MKLARILIILLGAVAIIFGFLLVMAANWVDTPAKYRAALTYLLPYLILGIAVILSGIILKLSKPRILFAGISSIFLVSYPFISDGADFSDKMVIFGIPLMVEVVILFLLNDARRSIK